MTEKKVKKHLKRIWFHWARLQNALQDAHNAEVICYPVERIDDSCCSCNFALKESIEKYTKEALVKTINRALREEAGW